MSGYFEEGVFRSAGGREPVSRAADRAESVGPSMVNLSNAASVKVIIPAPCSPLPWLDKPSAKYAGHTHNP